MSYSCPKCKSQIVETEKRPNGDSSCVDCGFKHKSIFFLNPVNTDSKPMTEPRKPREWAIDTIQCDPIDESLPSWYCAYAAWTEDDEKQRRVRAREVLPNEVTDSQMLDFLDEMNKQKNERNGSRYGWRLEENHNRIALTDSNFPALSVRDAIKAAMKEVK